MKEESWTKFFMVLALIASILGLYMAYENTQLVNQYNQLVYDYHNLSDELGKQQSLILESQRVNQNLTAENEDLKQKIIILVIALNQTQTELESTKVELAETKQKLNETIEENRQLYQKLEELWAKNRKPPEIPLDLSKYDVKLERFPVGWDGDYMKYARGFKKFLMEDHPLVTDFINAVEFVEQEDGTYILSYKDTGESVAFEYIDDMEQFDKLDLFQNPSYFIANKLKGDCDDINPLAVRILKEQGYQNIWLFLGLKQGYGHIWGKVSINGEEYSVDFARVYKDSWGAERAVVILEPYSEDNYDHVWARIRI
jgi:uncharacterized membrane protein YqjE